MLNNLANSSNYDIMMAIEDMRCDRMPYAFDDLKLLQTEVINRRLETKYISYLTELMCDMLESGKMEKKSAPSVSDVVEPSPKGQAVPHFAPAPMMANMAGNAPVAASSRPSLGAVNVPNPALSEPGRPDFLERTANMRKVTPVPRAALLPQKQNAEPPDISVRFPMLSFLQMFYKIMAWLCAVGTVSAYVWFCVFVTNGDMMLVYCGLAAAVFLSAMSLVIFYALSEGLRWKLEMIKALKEHLH